MLYRPTTLGAALHKVATTFPSSNHPLARQVRSNIGLNATQFSVPMADHVPKELAHRLVAANAAPQRKVGHG